MASLEESRRQLEETRSGMEGGMLEGERGGGGGGERQVRWQVGV